MIAVNGPSRTGADKYPRRGLLKYIFTKTHFIFNMKSLKSKVSLKSLNFKLLKVRLFVLLALIALFVCLFFNPTLFLGFSYFI